MLLPSLLALLYYLSRTHTWALPMFSVGLGFPRWCQTFWATSGIASYLPWAGAAGPYVSIALWLWLGVLDGIQGVGIGIMLLQTLSRVHVAATLFALQIVGTTTILIAHACAPHRESFALVLLLTTTSGLSPFSVFPNIAIWATQGGIANSGGEVPYFWIALVCQAVATTGYL
jgi:alpha-1,3-glucan synthase